MEKRLFDFVVAAMLLMVLFPILILIAISIKLTSRGPAIFKQERVGYKEEIFTIFKFRTMENGSGKMLDRVLKGDKRITKIGKIMRPTHLDELPQLWNVLRGEMSLVGPRPDLVGVRMQDGFKKRFAVKPGITGLVQLKGREWKISNGDTFRALDVLYVQSRSFVGDLRILFSTINVVLKRQGV